ncbi:GDP-mannose 4,6-dehydratase [Candidatus Enterococcus mansonii]|uniref:NAD-dependent epimerase/dehydratase n=1 Tax=Candidatus Enterococcus mansonii TaxID=1834181 RepID=A0A242CHN4_9ENTE|nr:GDP-mannose 4,6-dehydratase [Enterococcus sp. 4G2_DIV0659]OTO09753.1 NAD-dependent epimerase/dehydratase [Enterococcus sp. 4G2_DIV0659]
MDTILITGGAGFIGSTLASFYNKECKVVIVDDLSMGDKSNLADETNITFIKGSVTDTELMMNCLEKYQFDYIFHLAAIASVADSVERPIVTHQINFYSVLQLLELIKVHQKKLKRLVFSSSAAVYGDEPTLPKREESVIRPLTPYAIDKFAAEKYVVDYCQLYGIPTSAVRFFNVYGPNQNPNSPYSGVISIIMSQYKKILKKQDAVFTIFGDGKQSRDFVFIEDVVQALNLVAISEYSLGEVYNVGTGKSVSLNDLIDTLDSLVGKSLTIEYKEERPGDVKHSLADISKIKKLGYRAKFGIEDGLKKYVEYELNK